MSSQDSLNEYTSTVIDESEVVLREITAIFRSANFNFREFPEIKAYIKFAPENSATWEEKFSDDVVDMTRLTGVAFLHFLANDRILFK